MRKKLIKKTILKSFIALVSLIGFIYLAQKAFNKEIMVADITFYNLISKHIISEFNTHLAKIITFLGSSIILISIAIILLIVIKNKKIGVSICYNLALIASINYILKNIIQRPRPEEFQIITETGFSFPSGHTMISTAFYGYLIYLIYKNIINKKTKWILIIILSILIILIGLSRVYLGVHYISDVIAGFLISISYSVVYSILAKKYINNTKLK